MPSWLAFDSLPASNAVAICAAMLQMQHACCDLMQAKESEGSTNFAAMVQAMRIYVTVDPGTCPTDFLPIGISHYKTLNTVSPSAFEGWLCSFTRCQCMKRCACYSSTSLKVWLCCRPGCGRILITPCCRVFECYCESMGVELTHVRFLRKCGTRVQGSELLMDLKQQDDETLCMLPLAVPNTTEG